MASYQVNEYKWDYDGDCYHKSGYSIHSTYKSRKEAENTCLQLERAFWGGKCIHEIDHFANTYTISDASFFFKSKFDKTIEEMDKMPTDVSEELVSKFLEATGAKAYWVTSIDPTKDYFVLRFLKHNVYMRKAVKSWESPAQIDEILFGDSYKDLMSLCMDNLKVNMRILELHQTENLTKDLVFSGSFEEITNDIKILEEVRKKYRQVRYIKDTNELLVKEGSVEALFEINKILKHPIFKVEKLKYCDIQAEEISERKAARLASDSEEEPDESSSIKEKWYSRLLF